MKLLKKYNQMRRDCEMDIECEGCGNMEKGVSAYDDRNFWDNVLPNKNCEKCQKCSNDFDLEIIQKIKTKYPEGYQI